MAASDHAWALKPDHEREIDLRLARCGGGYDPRKRLLPDARADRIGATS
jgi:hypothetical protein